MAKYSDDAVELGASRVPAIVLGKTSFTTNERERQKTLHARQGIDTLETEFGKDVKERGNYLEPVLIEWTRDKLDEMSDDLATINLCKVTQGYRIDDLKLCASLDAILQVDGEFKMYNEMTDEEITLSGFGALEIKTTNTDDLPRTDQIIQLQTQLYAVVLSGASLQCLVKLRNLSLYPLKLTRVSSIKSWKRLLSFGRR